jgi:hypothetical protein
VIDTQRVSKDKFFLIIYDTRPITLCLLSSFFPAIPDGYPVNTHWILWETNENLKIFYYYYYYYYYYFIFKKNSAGLLYILGVGSSQNKPQEQALLTLK